MRLDKFLSNSGIGSRKDIKSLVKAGAVTVDGKVDGEEIKDFVHIQEELEKISITVEALQLWAEQMIAEGKIDEEAYRTYRDKLKK